MLCTDTGRMKLFLNATCRYNHLEYFRKKKKEREKKEKKRKKGAGEGKEERKAPMTFACVCQSKIAYLLCKIKHMAAKLPQKYISLLSSVSHSYRNCQVLNSDLGA